MNNPLADYERLREKLKKANEGKLIDKDTLSSYNVEKALEQSSSKHHYLPRYYIDGFLANDGLLDIYDKQRDVIKKDRKGSGGVFFEKHRNSADFGLSKPISLYEDAYGVIDNLLPAAIKLLRADSVKISKEIFLELMANINVFIVDLFWRNINTDQIFDDIYNNGDITITLSDSRVLSDLETDKMKLLPGFKQLARLQIFIEAIKEALKQDPDGIINGNLVDFPLEQICIGDMPFVFPIKTKTHIGLLQLPVIVPISKSKLYLRNVERKTAYDIIDTYMFNALVIEQSSRFICSANPNILDTAVDYYRFAKKNNCFDVYRRKLFFDNTCD